MVILRLLRLIFVLVHPWPITLAPLFINTVLDAYAAVLSLLYAVWRQPSPPTEFFIPHVILHLLGLLLVAICCCGGLLSLATALGICRLTIALLGVLASDLRR